MTVFRRAQGSGRGLPPWAWAVTAFALITAASGIAIAAGTPVWQFSGHSIGVVKLVRSPANSSVLLGDKYTLLKGSEVNLRVPSGERAAMLFTMSAQTDCPVTHGCTVIAQVMADDLPAQPAQITLLANPSDPSATGSDLVASNSFQLSAGPLAPGMHSFAVQVKDDAGGGATLDRWQLTVERIDP